MDDRHLHHKNSKLLTKHNLEKNLLCFDDLVEPYCSTNGDFFYKKKVIKILVTLALFFFHNYTRYELHRIYYFGLPSGENSPRERRTKKKKTGEK
jgi:hypothetical protein